MIRGTTPTCSFNVPCNGENIHKVNILFGQDDRLLFKKVTSDCTIDGSQVTAKLTREDTLRFNHKKPLQIQIVVEQTNGDVLESLIETIGVDKLLDDGVIE